MRFVEELWNQRKLDLANIIFDPDCHTHQLRSSAGEISSVPRGPEAVKKHVAEWLLGFPDLQFAVEQMLAEGDRVSTQLAMEGTHTGQWLGIPPTGKRVTIRMMTIHRIQENKIIEDWVIVESLGVFQQLGVLPPTTEFLAEFARRGPVADAADFH
jgi:predicted ester cyclase